MMVILLTMSCMILAAGVCSMSYIVVNKRLQSSEIHSSERDNVNKSDSNNPGSDTPSEPGKPRTKLKSLLSIVREGFNISPKSQWIVFTISVVLIGLVTFCAQTFKWDGSGIDTFGLIKILLSSQLMLSAAIIDYYTKKIPNYIPVVFLLVGIIILLFEFIFLREKFLILLMGSLLGLVGGFLILLLMSLITKGGIGMGDVKLISTMGFVSGIAAIFYSFFYATVLCLLVTLILLITKTKKLKDELPFGPFLFFGYILAIILGNF